MDGNGRWAERRGLSRIQGHREGLEAVRAVVRGAHELGIRFLTLYAFSLENWNRPKAEVDELKEKHGVTPGLVTILVGEDPASQSYVRAKNKTAKALGYNSTQDTQPADLPEDDLLGLVDKYNNDPDCHGILVQLPLPKHINDKKVLNAINPDKDVDGFHPVNVGRLMVGEPLFLPCTPFGIQERASSSWTWGHSTTATPPSARSVAMPETNPFRSGTWARTLFAWITSARLPSATRLAASSEPKNSSRVGIPRSRAAWAGPSAGSMPSTGMPRRR